MGELSPSVQAKMRRGKKHADALRRLARTWREKKSYRFVIEDDEDGAPEFHCYRAVVRITDPFPTERFSVTLSDYLHNRRGVLDYLVWELSVQNRGANLTNPRGVGFPIAADRDSYAGKGLHAVAAPVAAAIERLQPYHAGEDARSHPLWMLGELNRLDKHRSIHAVYDRALRPEWLVRPSVGGRHVADAGEALTDGAVVSHLTFPRSVYPGSLHVHVDFRASVA